MDELLGIARDWQEIIGAFLGGVFALGVAVYVARDARSREERAAAMVVVTAIVSFAGAYRAAKIRVESEENNPDRVKILMTTLFALNSPFMPSSASEGIHRLLLIDTHLAAHLSLLDMINSQADVALSRCRQDVADYVASGEKGFKRSEQSRLADARNIVEGGARMLNYAGCAELLLNRLVLSKFPTVNRIRHALFPDKLVKLCREGIKAGGFKEPVPWY